MTTPAQPEMFAIYRNPSVIGFPDTFGVERVEGDSLERADEVGREWIEAVAVNRANCLNTEAQRAWKEQQQDEADQRRMYCGQAHGGHQITPGTYDPNRSLCHACWSTVGERARNGEALIDMGSQRSGLGCGAEW